MAKCSFCGTTILFGGIRDREVRFCSKKCHQKGYALVAAKEIPKQVIDERAGTIHRGRCPRCQGNGPIDVHTSYRIYSVIVYSSWSSRPHVCCRSCGLRSQLADAVFSFLLGWWGFPWGLVMTPIQLGRNIAGMLSNHEEARPSEQLKHLVSIQIAKEALAHQRGGTT